MVEAKRVFAPDTLDAVLDGWLIHANKARDRHDAAARLYAKGQHALGIPSLVVSSIVGTAVFSAISSSDKVGWWVGLMSVAAAVLSALQTFMDYPGRMEKHRAAGVKYKAIIRHIELLTARQSQGHPPTDAELEAVQRALDTLEDSAPVVMPRIHATVEAEYKNMQRVKSAIELYQK